MIRWLKYNENVKEIPLPEQLGNRTASAGKLASTADAFSRISFLTFFTLVCAADVYGKKNFKEP
jgi:hypothetical protein